MDVPQDLRYTENHEWIRLNDAGDEAVVGVTDFAQHELGDIVFVELEPVDTALGKDDVFGTIEAVKTVAELYMPVAGTIVAHNEALDAAPEQVNEDPYGDGWMIRIRLDDPADADALLSSEAYADVIA